jgi:hypothetical protein
MKLFSCYLEHLIFLGIKSFEPTEELGVWFYVVVEFSFALIFPTYGCNMRPAGDLAKQFLFNQLTLLAPQASMT